MTLQIVPIGIADAAEFVRRHHRHHEPPAGAKFAVALSDGELSHVLGVAIVGRPVARHLDDGWTLEVTRLAVLDGVANACSKLYGAAWRAARAMGYRRLVTFTLATEPGTSLRAAGWREVGRTRAQGWDRPSRPRVDRHPAQQKIRWEVAV